MTTTADATPSAATTPTLETRTAARRYARKAWRSAATLACAAALIAALQMAWTGAASADSCWQDANGTVHCMYDGGTIRPGEDGGGFGGGGGGGTRPRPIIGDPDPIDPGAQPRPQPRTGIERAGALLDNDTCANFIAGATSTPQTGKTADDARRIYNAVPKTYANDYKAGRPNVYADAPVGAGEQGRITLYTPYTLITADDVNRLGLPEGTKLSRPLNREEVQAAVLLHETAHLTGALSQGHNLGRDSATVDPVWEMMMLQACFGVVTQPL